MTPAAPITEGFLLGLSLAPTCLTLCLPVLLPYFISEDQSWPRRFKTLGVFLLGRAAGYVAIGAAAGALGQAWITRAGFAQQLEGTVWFLLGAVLVLYGLLRTFPHASVCSRVAPLVPASRFPWLLGLLTGLSVCPPLLAAGFAAFRSGGALSGASLLSAFFVASSLIFLPVPLFGLLARSEAWRWASRIAAVCMGAWLMLRGAAGWI